MQETHGAALGAAASSIRRAGRGLLLALLAGIVSTGCSRYFWNAPKSWALKGQLESVAESSPHGVLVLQRDNENIYMLVDGKAAFRSVRGTSASFRLPPGTHEIRAQYTATEGNYAVTSGPLRTSIALRTGQSVTVRVSSASGGIRFVTQ